MTRAFTRLAYTDSVREAQRRNGSREHNDRMAQRPPERDSLPEEMQARIAAANSIIVGTASLEGWPHLQHRGGPRGFIKVLGPRRLAFADFSGSRQYITIGNLAENDRVFLLLIDYAARTRLKIWGRARVVEDDPALLELVRDPDYRARVERAIVIDVAAWDTNCSSHIPHLVAA
ncbi:MAG TPA: pyridoxamine 5'-phosphate oxidase family protein [Acetobacteraceae bacterium]|nr:pyridoxamine 5'-phosphate oxidase family protein [Acetobacteraceae bacterium]